MNNRTLLFATLALLFIFSCKNESSQTSVSTETSAEHKNFFIHYPSDTINFTGADGKKHGIWLEDNQQVVYNNDTAYPVTDSTIQEVINRLNKQNGY